MATVLRNPSPHDSHAYDNEAEQARIRWIKIHVIGKALEVGCANGDIANAIGADGMDCDDQRIAICKKIHPHLNFFIGDAREYLPTGYDTIVFAEVLEHMSMLESQATLASAIVRARRVIFTIAKDTPKEDVYLGHQWPTDEAHIIELLSILMTEQPQPYKIRKYIVGKSWCVVIDK